MSSRVTLSRRSLVRGLSLLVAAAPALAACGNGGIRPLYGATPSGAGLQERMAQVDVATIPGRVGQRIRNDLIFLSTGGEKDNIGIHQFRHSPQLTARFNAIYFWHHDIEQHQIGMEFFSDIYSHLTINSRSYVITLFFEVILKQFENGLLVIDY